MEAKQTKSNIYKKLQKLQAILFGKAVKKSGKNTYSNYDYSTKEDVIEAVQEAVVNSGLLFLFDYPECNTSEVTLKDGSTKIAGFTLNANVKVIDPESGESIKIPMIGYAEDSQDKAVWKAYTGLQKYFWLKQFHLQDNDISSEPEGDDPRTVRAKKGETKSGRKITSDVFNGLKKKIENSKYMADLIRVRGELTENKKLGLLTSEQAKELGDAYDKKNNLLND